MAGSAQETASAVSQGYFHLEPFSNRSYAQLPTMQLQDWDTMLIGSLV